MDEGLASAGPDYLAETNERGHFVHVAPNRLFHLPRSRDVAIGPYGQKMRFAAAAMEKTKGEGEPLRIGVHHDFVE